ncbi:MAG: quinone-dependent dihydroorotate dehydrogenase [Candidatus Uhrbacteria bacterium]
MIHSIARATQFLYEHAAKPALFRLDPERVHDQAIGIGAMVGRSRTMQRMLHTAYAYTDPILEQELHGVRFPNPIGLAAGFDKNGRIPDALAALGFGFAEIGSVTARMCSGNAKPRLWRLPKSKALQVYYGLPNDGAAIVADRVRRRRDRMMPIGMSVAKTNAPSAVDRSAGIEDYLIGLRAVSDVGSYITINVSCPNAFGGEPFTDSESLDALLTATDTLALECPVFLKLPCDMSIEELDVLLECILRHRVQGIILSNLTKDRSNPSIDVVELRRNGPNGGVSGAPMRARVNMLIARAAQRTGGRLTIVGCGGVASVDDVYEKIRLGASLIQLITGMIYHGPSLIGQLASGVAERCRLDGFANIHDAIGSGLRVK